MNKFKTWLNARFPLDIFWKKHFTEYYVPKNLNILYLFGAFALLVLINQFLTGIWLTMFYTPTAQDAFASIQYIMRDVNYGWLLRYMHSTGASAFFIVIYVHIFKALLYGSYQKPRELVWLLGMFLYVFLIMEAFFGYVLPWGQMSYWGAQVITALLGAMPYVGDTLVLWFRGDYSVGLPTLQRFFSLHVIAIPLLILFFLFLHVVALRVVGANNPQGMLKDKQGNKLIFVAFHPYYFFKDLLAVLVFLIIFFAMVFFLPTMGGYFLEPSNLAPANPLITPEHIAPVWYMSPFYAILRTIPHKLMGIMTMFSALFVLFLLPWLDKSPVLSMRYKGIWSKLALFLFVLSVFILGYIGRLPLTAFRFHLSQIALFFYFAYFILMPFYTRYERCKPLPGDC